MSEMAVKQISKTTIQEIKSVNPKKVETPVVEKTAAEIELENFEKSVREIAGLK